MGHTQGIWDVWRCVDGEVSEKCYYIMKNDRILAKVPFKNNLSGKEEKSSRANAILMGASSQLLHAAQLARGFFKDFLKDEENRKKYFGYWTALNRAIEQATSKEVQE